MPENHVLSATLDYGHAIKDLCAANIFPGDLFTKNFGVTRHGSVVFYDYDELTLLQDVTFRSIPEARSFEDEMSSQPWFAVGANDVFPEEFKKFSDSLMLHAMPLTTFMATFANQKPG